MLGGRGAEREEGQCTLLQTAGLCIELRADQPFSWEDPPLILTVCVMYMHVNQTRLACSAPFNIFYRGRGAIDIFSINPSKTNGASLAGRCLCRLSIAPD